MRQILAKVLALVGLCGVFVVSWNCAPEGSLHVLACEPTNIDFGEVVVGSATEMRFEVENPSDLYTAGNLSGPSEFPSSTVRLHSFSITECNITPSPFSIGETLPIDLVREESSELTVEFAPIEAGDWTCEAIPEYTLVDVEVDAVPETTYHTCTMHLTGSTAAAPEPSCALQPGTVFEYGEVEVGSSRELTLTIRNETLDALATNQFKFSFDGQSDDCGLFRIDPADTALSVLGPGDSREISVWFIPDAPGSFECSRSLSSLKEPADAADPNITNACPTEVTWRGTGVAGPLTWNDCSQFDITEDLHGIYGISENQIYTAGDAFTVRFSGGACSWGDVPGPAEFDNVNLTDVWGISNEIWAVGNTPPPPSQNGAIFRADNTSGWTQVDEGWMVTYGALWGSAADDIYFVGTGVSTDLPNTKYWNGTNIDTLSIDWGMSELTSVHGTASDDVWAVLGQSIMATNWVYRFQGTEWEAETLPFTASPLHDVWAVQGTGFYAVYAVGEDGAIYHYDGSTWSDESIAGETDDFYGVWVSETGQAWVVGQNGAIYHKSGTNWTLENPPAGLERDLFDVWGSSDENVFAVGADGLILRYAR